MRPLHLCLLLLFGLTKSQKTPRLKLTPKDAPTSNLTDLAGPTVLFHETGSDKVYIGGRGGLKILTFTDSEAVQSQIPLKADEKAVKDCKRRRDAVEADCDNFIRVIQRLRNNLAVCGSSVGSPKCWLLFNDTALKEDKQGQVVTTSDAEKIAPKSPSQTVVTIAVEDNLYSAFSGSKSSIQRSHGTKRKIKTEDSWLGKTEFISAALLSEKDSTRDEIYFFYNDVNETAGRDDSDGEAYKAHLGRVCKVDDGGRPLLTDSWSTFLKARLVCGQPNDPRRFPRLRDAFVVQEGREPGATLYGVFSSIWGTSAVCSYSMTNISNFFKTSKFKGYTGPVPGHRPGTCFPPNPNVSLKSTLTIIKDHPEIDTVIYPEKGPLYILQNNDTYTRVVVDRVRDASVARDVLFLGTAKGKIHKVLQSQGQTVIIAELSPFEKEAPVSSMILDDNAGHLYVSTEFEAARLPLANCSQYNKNCWDCVLTRDPYCGWDPDGKTCSAVFQNGNYTGRNFRQRLDSQAADACKGAEDKATPQTPKKVSVDPTSYIYLPCPLRSHHAIYTWAKDGGKTYPCSMDEQSCTLHFESGAMDEGVFKCTATENGYKEEIAAYKVTLNSGRIPEVSLVAVAVGILFLSITILLL